MLDNCEHLLDEVVDVVELILSRARGPRILATSREALGAEGEQVMRVPSLSVDVGAAGDTRDDELGPAVELLVERANASGIGLFVTALARPILGDICRRLDGIPLAIELAAAQLVVLTPAELLERLDRRFDLLVGGHGRRRQRQQTLQAMMDWSWELLTADEQRLLAVVSVFTGQWSLDAAEATAGAALVTPVAVVLRSLVAKSLVEPVFAADRSRFRLLETVRMFGSARLVELGLADETRSAHAHSHLDRSRSVDVESSFFDNETVYAISLDIEDIDVAIEWSIGTSEWSDAAELTVFTSGCRMVGIQSRNGVRWVQLLESKTIDRVLRSRVLATGAFAAIANGEHHLSRRWEREALELAHGFDAFASSLAACNSAAPLVLTDPDRARVYLLDAHAVAERNGSVPLRGFVQFWINLADFCQPTIDLPIAADDDIEAFGGRGSVSWTTIRAAGAIRRAEQGHYDDALSLLTIGAQSDCADAHRRTPSTESRSRRSLAILTLPSNKRRRSTKRSAASVTSSGAASSPSSGNHLPPSRSLGQSGRAHRGRKASADGLQFLVRHRSSLRARSSGAFGSGRRAQVIDRARRTSVDQLLQRDFGALAQRLESVRPE